VMVPSRAITGIDRPSMSARITVSNEMANVPGSSPVTVKDATSQSPVRGGLGAIRAAAKSIWLSIWGAGSAGVIRETAMNSSAHVPGTSPLALNPLSRRRWTSTP